MSRLNILVLEPDAEKCEELLLKAAEASLGLPVVTEVVKVMDMEKIKKYNVSSTPGLVINNTVKVFDGIPQKEEIRKWIHEEYKKAV